MNNISICPSCIYRNNCVLTMQKDKVWSCSEYDKEVTDSNAIETMVQPKENEEKTLELV